MAGRNVCDPEPSFASEAKHRRVTTILSTLPRGAPGLSRVARKRSGTERSGVDGDVREQMIGGSGPMFVIVCRAALGIELAYSRFLDSQQTAVGEGVKLLLSIFFER